MLEQPKWSPQRVFAQEVLEKEVRLAYWERIKEVGSKSFMQKFISIVF